MKAAPILAVLVVGGLIGWYSPEVSGSAAPVAANAAEQPEAPARWSRRAEVSGDAGWSGGELVLQREADGHFYADVSVDSYSTRMLVDTAATVIALTGDDAEAMGITWQPEDVRPIAKGASGAVDGVAITLRTVQIGDIEAREIEAVIVPEGLGISLLGQSFLSRIDRVEIMPEGMLLAS